MAYHFQDTHAKGIDIDLLVILFIVELGGHELGSTENRGDVGAVANNSEAEVTNLELTIVAVDKDVVALKVTVDDGRAVGMEIGESLEDLSAPGLYDFGLECALERLFEILLQGTRGHELGDKDDAFSSSMCRRG